MSEETTILAPIRYPLTDDSARTLAAAGRLAQDRAPAELRALHVNLFQTNADIQTEELTRAISSTLDDVDASVHTRCGFLVEKAILEEAIQIDADVIVVGANRQGMLRRLLGRALGNGPAVGSFLRENAPDGVEIVEVNTVATTPSTERRSAGGTSA